MYVREMTLLYRDRPGPMSLDTSHVLRTPRDAAALFIGLLAAETVEVFGMVCLTTKQRLIGYYEVSRGTLDSTAVHPRDVFKAAMLANAAAIIVGHNHPSGDPTPSSDDRALTSRLTAAGDLVGISVLDHIIVGCEQRYTSFVHLGLIAGLLQGDELCLSR